jgi:antitoxin (DNA-binding transcriptional repressor) of toxin-antitoxin stability system
VKTVGVRELKNRLSEYLRMVRAGESVLITDRGEVVAELHAPGRGGIDDGVPAGLQALARRGLVRLGGPNDKSAYKRLTRALQKGSGRILLDQERGDK